MKKNLLKRNIRKIILAGITTLLLFSGANAQIQLNTMGSAYTENFDGLSNTAGTTTNNLTLTGWFMTESGGGGRDNEQYAVDPGSSNTGDTYSYGSAGSTDRAIGGLRTGTLIPVFGASFTNNTGSSIGALEISFTGEEWRLGTSPRADQISFEISLDATSLTTGTWNNITDLNFTTPNTTPVGAKDGNLAANRTALSTVIDSLSIANGATFWIRWTDIDASGADDGLAVDDFSLTPHTAALPTISINDMSIVEEDTVNNNLTFTINLSQPAGPGGVTFDISTSDSTAMQPGDYTATSLTGQMIAMGDTAYTFTVPAVGDYNIENDEYFYVIISNVQGAFSGDTLATGTIFNNDIAPFITVDPLPQTVCAGTTATFNASGSGSPIPDRQWQVSTDGGLNWNDITGATSGMYSFIASMSDNGNMYRLVLNSPTGADTSAPAAITVYPSYNTTEDISVCAGDSYTFPDGSFMNNITSPFTHISNLVSVNNCDSIITTNIFVNPVYYLADTVSICYGGSYTFHDGTTINNITSTLNYSSNFTTTMGCDSIIITTVNINSLPAVEASANVLGSIVTGNGITITICNGMSLTLNGTGASAYTWDNGVTDGVAFSPVATPVNYTVTGTDTNGCSNTAMITIEVNPSPAIDPNSLSESTIVCAGANISYKATGGTDYLWTNANGDTLSLGATVNITANNSTTYYVSVTDANGCSGTDSIYLNVSPVYNLNETVQLCSGSDYTFPDGTLQTNITSTIVHTSYLTSSMSCDSSITTTVNVVSNNYTFNDSICDGDTYMFAGMSLTMAGTYSDTTNGTAGCDSVTVLHLFVKQHSASSIDASICDGDSLVIGNNIFNIQGNYVFSIPNAAGCDSTITLNLIVNSHSSAGINASICDGSSYSFGGNNLTTAGVYTNVITNAAGCDSTITLNLSVISYTDSFDVSICEGTSYMFGGSPYNTDGTYTHVFSSSEGCDSTVTINLSFLPTYSATINDSICDGDVYNFNGQSYTSNGTYIAQLTTVNGCDSIITLVLKVKQLPGVSLTAAMDTACFFDSPIALTTNPSGGTLSGNGVVGNSFDPMLAPMGDNQIVYTYNDGQCSNADTISIFVDICQGINTTLAKDVRLYPNPAIDLLTIETSGMPVLITITDTYGNIVNTVKSANKTIVDMKGYAQGVYFIKVENNIETAVYKVVKQ